MSGRLHPADIRLLPGSGRAEWDEVCTRFADATAFHRFAFLAAVAPALGCTFVPLAVLAAGRPVGVAPLLVKPLGPFCTINWVPFPYLGPLVPATLLPATLAALTREARRRGAVNHQQCLSRWVTGCSVGGFRGHADRTFVVPLAGRRDEDLLAAMQRGRRQELRRAQRAGFEVGSAEAADFRLMDSWAGEVYAAQGLPAAYPAGTYNRMFLALRNAPGTAFEVARLRGRTVAVNISLATPRRAFGWQAAVDPAYREDFPQVLLMWRALMWARRAGAVEFDLTGAPNDGIAAYKSRFGAGERRYTVLRRQAWQHRMATSVRARMSRFA